MSAEARPLDEMVDGRGGLRTHWRTLIGAFSMLGEGGIAERGRRLDQAFDEEGVTSVLPGSGNTQTWRCDPVPLPIAAAEFAALEKGLAQRATLLQAILQDLYGPQTLLAEGILPPALVFANPAFLRACHRPPGAGPEALLQSYAADLVRGPDGCWRVLADRTAAPSGAGYALENRRILARVMPEAFRGLQVRQLRPFFELWQEALQRLAPAGRPNPSVALLTPGTSHPQWFEHMFLSRELSCGLVEGGDLTVRGGGVFLKTLRGLQRVDVLLRRVEGRLIDPLELDVGGGAGVTGLMDAMRSGQVRIVNDPGSGVLQAPALAAFLPRLAEHLLGEKLLLPSVPTYWLGQPDCHQKLDQNFENWLIRPATDGLVPAVRPRTLPEPERAALRARIAAAPDHYAASAWIAPSVAPCAAPQGMVPKPIVLRLFAMFDNAGWRTMQGGLARVVEEPEPLAGQLPHMGLSKDVIVLNEEAGDIVGPPARSTTRLQIRRTTGELPSRVADNLFWLGRYVERLEDSARLVRSTLTRLGRGNPMPRDAAELEALSRCLVHAGMIEADTKGAVVGQVLTDAVLRSLREGGRIALQFNRVARLTETARDRLTDDMYTTFTQSLRLARAEADEAGRSLDDLSRAMIGILRFSASVAGVAAENMVRGGGWLFLDLGRRIERAQAVAAEVSRALDQSPARIEAGLRLVLELCDSAITYRTRYLTVLQPAPVLDLVLADEGNPRGLAFQLVAMRTRLEEVAGRSDTLTMAASSLIVETAAIVQAVLDSPDPALTASQLPPRLRAVETGVAALSDRISRRYFALLPAAQTLGVPSVAAPLRGVA
jgi:uncharacterized circularly permuted ATP-grasp superfamily protein/uncharacterized alpha-E superfamily protein